MSESNLKFDGIWENSLILALRDLQWLKATEKGRSEKPQGLVVLDGNAESALGDTALSANDRLFLFEFKSSSSDGRSESEKILADVMRKIKNASDEEFIGRGNFISASSKAHHFVFADSEKQAMSGVDNLATRFVTLYTTPYYTAIRDGDGKVGKLPKGPDIVTVLYPKPDQNTGKVNQKLGLDVVSMAHYLTYLVENYELARLDRDKNGSSDGESRSGGSENGGVPVPFKGLMTVASEKFIWPCVDMADLKQVLQLLQNFLNADPELKVGKMKDYPVLNWKSRKQNVQTARRASEQHR